MDAAPKPVYQTRRRSAVEYEVIPLLFRMLLEGGGD